MINMNALSDDVLEKVSGGAQVEDTEGNRKAFGEAWKKKGMEGKGFSGLARGELYEAWLDSTIQDPAVFLESKIERA